MAEPYPLGLVVHLPRIKRLWVWNTFILFAGWVAIPMETPMTLLVAIALVGLSSLLFSERYFRILGAVTCALGMSLIVVEYDRLGKEKIRLDQLRRAHEKEIQETFDARTTNK